MTDERLDVHGTNTHLYPGARLAADVPVAALGASPRGLRIVFRDGSEVHAELLQNDAGELAVDAPAHRTAAGTEIAAKAWRVDAEEAGDGSVLVVTGRL
jgi:hypothetical protein